MTITPKIKRNRLWVVALMVAGLAAFPALSLGVEALPVNMWIKGYLSLLTLQAGTAVIVLSYLRWGKRQEL